MLEVISLILQGSANVIADLNKLKKQLQDRETQQIAKEEDTRASRISLESDKKAFLAVVEMWRLMEPKEMEAFDVGVQVPKAIDDYQGGSVVKRTVNDCISILGRDQKEFSSSEIIYFLRRSAAVGGKPVPFDLDANRSNISNHLKDLEDSGVIVKTGDSSGRTAAKYKWKSLSPS